MLDALLETLGLLGMLASVVAHVRLAAGGRDDSRFPARAPGWRQRGGLDRDTADGAADDRIR